MRHNSDVTIHIPTTVLLLRIVIRRYIYLIFCIPVLCNYNSIYTIWKINTHVCDALFTYISSRISFNGCRDHLQGYLKEYQECKQSVKTYKCTTGCHRKIALNFHKLTMSLSIIEIAKYLQQYIQ